MGVGSAGKGVYNGIPYILDWRAECIFNTKVFSRLGFDFNFRFSNLIDLIGLL